MRKKFLGVFMVLALMLGLAAVPEAVNAQGSDSAVQIKVQIGEQVEMCDSLDEAVAKVRAAAGDADKKIILPAGEFKTTADNLLRIDVPNTTITGEGSETVINTEGHLVSGQAGILVAADNVTIENLKVISNHTATSAGTIKVSTIGDEKELPNVHDVRLSNLTIEANGNGYALNLHGVEGAVITNVTARATQFLKAAVNIANATGINFNALKAEGNGTDVVFSYKENSVAYDTVSEVSFENSTFANNVIRTERPSTAVGGSDTIKLSNDNLLIVKKGDGTWSTYKKDSTTVASAIHNETQNKYYLQSALQTAISETANGDVIALQPGTYSDDITIDKTITLKGAGETNEDVILTGAVNITADDVALDNMWFQQTYTGNESVSRLTTTGKNLTVSNSIIQRMTGTAKPYGDIITYNAAEGTLKLLNTELIAPVSGDKSTIAGLCPSVIGVGSWNTPGQEAWNLVMEGCTVRTNGFAIFDRWNNAAYTDTTFTGLEEVEGLPADVTVLTCYMALNNSHVDNVSFGGCTFKNMRSWGILAAGNSLSVVSSTFEGSNQSRAISVGGGYGTVDNCTIEDNVFDLAGSGYGVKFEDSVTADSRIVIEDNIFKNSNNEEDGYAVANVDGEGNDAPVAIWANGSTFINSSVQFLGAVNPREEDIPEADAVVLVQDNAEYYLETLTEALSRAQEGDTIRLLDDISETVTVNMNVTILKNGYKLDISKATGAENYYMTETDDAYVFTYHHMVKTEAKEPTCTQEGNIAYWYCDDCDKYFSDEDCTKEIALKDTVIAMTEHTADGTGWHSDEISHWNTCECGEKLNEAAHIFQWVTDREATATEAGSKHEECTVCGYEEAAVAISAAGTPTDSTDTDKLDGEQTGDTASAETSDDSNIALWAAAMLAAGSVMTGTALYSRKRKYSR